MFPEIWGKRTGGQKIDRPVTERSKEYLGPADQGYGLNFMKTAESGGKVIGSE
jgi:hypothetical protein